MKRLITGLIMGACWLLLLFKGPSLLFWLVVVLGAAAGLVEYLTMISAGGGQEKKLRGAVLVPALFPVLAAYWGDLAGVGAGIVLAFLCLAGLALVFYTTIPNPFLFFAQASFGTLYVGLLAAHLPLIMRLAEGNAWLLWLTAIIVASDAGAYYSGNRFGRHKLCPSVSPGKTVEGFVGGLLLAVLASLMIKAYFFPHGSPLKLMAVAVALSCVGVAGDLTESIIKRTCGVKDSGTLLPGHGGVLDRIDSLLFAAPPLFYLLHFGILN